MITTKDINAFPISEGSKIFFKRYISISHASEPYPFEVTCEFMLDVFSAIKNLQKECKALEADLEFTKKNLRAIKKSLETLKDFLEEEDNDDEDY